MNSQENGSLNRRYESLQRVAPGVFAVPDKIVNAYLVGNRDSWVLVDAGLPGSANRFKQAAEESFGVGARPRAIVLTHGHFDHVGSLVDLVQEWQVPVYAHTLELPYLTGMSYYPPPDPTVGGGAMSFMSRFFPTKPLDLGDWVKPLPLIGELAEMPGWRIIHTPGHAPGHVSFFREEDSVLIAGDAFVTTNQESFWSVVTRKQEIHRPPAYFTQDWEAAQRSVEHLANLQPAVVATGHGLPMRGTAMQTALQHLAKNFWYEAVPARGRYVREPALFDERGVAHIPPAVPDPTPKILVGIGIAALAGIAVYAWMQRSHEEEDTNNIAGVQPQRLQYRPFPEKRIPLERRVSRPAYQ